MAIGHDAEGTAKDSATAGFFCRPGILRWIRNVLTGGTTGKHQSMPPMLVRYRVKPDAIAENERLIGAVFRELHAKAPPHVRYLVLSLSDGTFCHLVEDKSKTIASLAAFAAFRDGGGERRLDEPQQLKATVVGNYRMLAES
jgi:hypothetical protein